VEEVTVDLNTLRRRLEVERKSLMERLKTSVRPVDKRPESACGKEGEAASDTFELEKHLALENRVRDLLAEVEHALRKFELGTYGLCDVCGQPIEPARLEALPQANLCLNCKAQEEGRKKHVASRRENSRETEAYVRYSIADEDYDSL